MLVMNNASLHIPVLLEETLNALLIEDGEFYIDATFGLGGYSKAILQKNNCKVLAIDRDPEAEIIATQFKKDFKNRFFFINGNFSEIVKFVKMLEIETVAGITFDLGVSSPQLDQGNRGFSFRLDGPLDMRMSKKGATAEEIRDQDHDSWEKKRGGERSQSLEQGGEGNGRRLGIRGRSETRGADRANPGHGGVQACMRPGRGPKAVGRGKRQGEAARG